MSRSTVTAEGTNLFSGTQSNFRLIRTTHRAAFSSPLNNTWASAACYTQIMGYVGKFSTEGTQRRPIEPLCSRGNAKDQLMNWLGPLLAWVCKACLPEKGNWQLRSSVGVLSDECVALVGLLVCPLIEISQVRAHTLWINKEEKHI